MNAVVFDMDGVICDSEVHWKRVEHGFLKGLIPTWDDAAQESIIGLSLYDVYNLLAASYGLTISRTEFVDYYYGLASQVYGEWSSLIDGCEELINQVHHKNIPLAIASSSPKSWINLILDRFCLREKFAHVVSSDDVGGTGKPSPDVYIEVAKRLGVEPQHCVAIEDTEKGIRSAKTAGMHCIGFRNGFNESQDLGEADLVVEGFENLPLEVLLQWF